jgi:SAM-dependent methyltransferase/ribosome-binding factor A
MPLDSDLVNIPNLTITDDDESWKTFISSTVFNKPLVLPESAWTEHVPFAFWLLNAVKPRVFVELGTHYGTSYFAFCEAIKINGLSAKTFAVDTWKGDEHAGFYENSIFELVDKTNQPFRDFSTLQRSTFDEAIPAFEDKSIDLLHIDGHHTYESVKHDFDSWLPKMSESGIVLFHDTQVKERGFGVYKLWEELSALYPHFEFRHGFGLGILGVGRRIPEKAASLFKIAPDTRVWSSIQEKYARLGNLYRIEQEYARIISIMGPVSGLSAAGGGNSFLPLHKIQTQIFWKQLNEEFNESNSLTQDYQLSDTKSTLVFKIDLSASPAHIIRIDPAAEKGVFYLHAISIWDVEGNLLSNWDSVREKSIFQNLFCYKSSLTENTLLAVSLTNDPIIEVEFSDSQHAGINKSIELRIEVSEINDGSLSHELANITTNELKTGKNMVQVYNKIFEDLHATKKEFAENMEHMRNMISSELHAQRELIKNELENTQSVMPKKDELLTGLLAELNVQREMIKNELLIIQKKDELVNSLSAELNIYKRNYEKSIFGIIKDRIFKRVNTNVSTAGANPVAGRIHEPVSDSAPAEHSETGMSDPEPETNFFDYEGFKIPVNLINLTGGGVSTWDAISKGHMWQYSKYSPIEPDHSVLEIGCGTGRDAIQLTRLLSAAGSYFGVDIIKPSIAWCQKNISSRFPNFQFLHYDIRSQLHNSKGKIGVTDIQFPIQDKTIDRIILQSVFTHMFETEITHYLKEFHRVMKDDARICASFFIISPEALEMAKNTAPTAESLVLTFSFPHGEGCYINDANYPEGAVGFTEEALHRMMENSELELDQPIHLGTWCGRTDVTDGQDMVILRKKKTNA